jgi:hypothetical protein
MEQNKNNIKMLLGPTVGISFIIIAALIGIIWSSLDKRISQIDEKIDALELRLNQRMSEIVNRQDLMRSDISRLSADMAVITEINRRYFPDKLKPGE